MNSGAAQPERPEDDADADKTIQSDEFAQPDDQENFAGDATIMLPDEADESAEAAAGQGTVLSDEFEQPASDASDSCVSPTISSEEFEVSDSIDSQTLPSDLEIGGASAFDSQTMLSDEDDFESSTASQATVSDDSFQIPSVQPSVPEIDSSVGSGHDSQAAPTISSHDSAFDSGGQTFISGDDFDLQDPGKTVQSFDGDDQSGVTFISDEDVSQMVSRTWGADVNSGTGPAMTIKADELFAPETGSAHSGIPARRLEQPAPNSQGEYELLKVLGEGGMGIVWNAKQRSVERNVAIKMIKSKIAAKAKQTEKFIAEAIVTGDLEHPNIVPIHELGIDQEGNYFYAMKHVQGTPWNKAIKKMGLHENLNALLDTCDAIAFAHARGIIHRDLKPENIMLGDYGEVLVMDWGLALPTEEFTKKDLISRAHGMGGTPAYMAPEMATGPISRIDYTSDVYLLGAILFEIVTGAPPHKGKTTQQCLAAAMRNTIAETDHSNELIDIARKAMETDQKLRFQTVKQFQAAIRNYLAHEKSLEISRRAEQEFDQARESLDYSQFARSLFGFEEAIALWMHNEQANDGLVAVRRIYAETALDKGDFDLAESLIDTTDPELESLSLRLQEAKQDRLARQRMLSLAKKAVATLAAVILVIIGVSYFLINQEVKRAVRAEGIANDQREIAEDQKKIAEQQTDIAVQQKQLAEQEREKADASRMVAERERLRAEQREEEAKQQRAIAVQEKEKAEIARQAEQYESYIARIGLAAAKVEENAFQDARDILEQCPLELRNWEWGRLMYLCSQSSENYIVDAPVDSLVLSPDDQQFATASWDGLVRVWERANGIIRFELKHSSIYVHSVDWSRNNRLIATGSADKDGNLKIWSAENGDLLTAIPAHEDAVVGVCFSDDSRWLITCSYDNTARLWDLAEPTTPQLKSTLVGHTWWVWAADFIPGFDPASQQNQLVTVGQDGRAIVWQISPDAGEAKPLIEFLEHDGPVYSVKYRPDGQLIATAGYDRKIHLWNPDAIEPFDYQAAVSGELIQSQVSRQLQGHIGPVRCLAFSQSGNLLVSGSQDNTVRIWETESGESIKTFRGHDSAVRACAISAAGNYIFSGSEDEQAILWSVDQYAELQTLSGQELNGHADAILSAQFANSGAEVITSSRDRSARIWDVKTGTQKQLLTEGHQFLSSTARFIQQERYLITAAADNTVRIWDAASGTELRQLNGTGRFGMLEVSDDEQWLATGSEGEAVQIWSLTELLDFEQGIIQPVQQLAGTGHLITSLKFVPEHSQLVTGDTHGRCALWDIEQGNLIWSERHHTLKITGIDFSADHQLLLTSSLDRTIGVSQLETGEEHSEKVLALPAPVVDLHYLRDSNQLLTISNQIRTGVSDTEYQMQLVWWDFETKQQLATYNFDGLQANQLSSAPGSRSVYVTCSDNTLKRISLQNGAAETLLDAEQHGGLIWSSLPSADGRRLLTIGGVDARLWSLATREEILSFGPHGAVATSAISPDGKLVVTGSWDHSLKFWNANTGLALQKIAQAHQGYINSVSFSQQGDRIVSAGDDGVAYIWDVASGQRLQILQGHTAGIHRAIFSPNDQLVLTASRDRTLRIWNSADGTAIGEPFVGHRWAVLAAEFSPDGQRIISCSEDNNAILWQVATGEEVVVMSGHTAAVTGVCFSPDGKRVLTSSRDNTAKLWDVSIGHEGQEILTLRKHTREVTAVDFSQNSLFALTASRDGTAVLWPAVDWRVPEVAAIPIQK